MPSTAPPPPPPTKKQKQKTHRALVAASGNQRRLVGHVGNVCASKAGGQRRQALCAGGKGGCGNGGQTGGVRGDGEGLDAGCHISQAHPALPWPCPALPSSTRHTSLDIGQHSAASKACMAQRTAVVLDRLVQLDFGQVHAEDLLAPGDVGAVDGDLPVEAACSRSVRDTGALGTPEHYTRAQERGAETKRDQGEVCSRRAMSER